jgi:Putative collagen-binding domain of a collagenase
VNVGVMSLPITARWYDATNGTFQMIKTYTAAESAQLTTPGNNSTGDADWLLVLEP